MNNLSLTNFRVFENETNFDLAPLTILTGKNNSGKSSLLKSFLILDELLSSKDHTVLDLNGPKLNKHKINNFGNLKNWESANKQISLSYFKNDFKIDFVFEGINENNYADLKSVSIKAVQINEELILDRLSSFRYDLSVSQKFIDYAIKGEEFKKALLNEQSFAKELRSAQAMLEHIKNKMRLLNASGETEYESIMDVVDFEYITTYNPNGNDEGLREREKSRYHELEYLIEEKQVLEAKTKKLNNALKALQASETGVKYSAEIVNVNSLSDKTIPVIVQSALVQYLDKQGKKAKANSSNEHQNLIKFTEKLKSLLTLQIYHLGPNRTYQSRLYLKGTGNSEINDVIDEFVKQAPQLKDNTTTLLNFWLKEFGIGDSVRVDSVEGVASKIIISRNNRDTNLIDLGFGAGQLLTIFLLIATVINKDSANSETKPIILIEEPESNLHPKLQSTLAKLLIYAAKDNNIQFVVETHSEYLIRKLQLLVAQEADSVEENAVLPSDALIYYLDSNLENADRNLPEHNDLTDLAKKSSLGGTSVRRIEILPDGKLSDSFGTGFIDEADEQALQLHRVQRKKQLEK